MSKTSRKRSGPNLESAIVKGESPSVSNDVTQIELYDWTVRVMWPVRVIEQHANRRFQGTPDGKCPLLPLDIAFLRGILKGLN